MDPRLLRRDRRKPGEGSGAPVRGHQAAARGEMSVSDLPALNASLNALATVLLVIGIITIKQERKAAHGYFMGAAFVTSCVFLVSYVTHKVLMHGVHTPFGGAGAWRPLY